MKTIVWDVDDVLNDLMAAWFYEAWLPAHRDCTVTYAQIAQNPIARRRPALAEARAESDRSTAATRASTGIRGLTALGIRGSCSGGVLRMGSRPGGRCGLGAV